MNNENNRDEPSASQKGAGRRRFVRGVGVSIPVLLTIPARSALANTCSSVSANASIVLANSHNATGDIRLTCGGKSPATLAGLPSTDFASANQNFAQIFGSGPNLTMEHVLKSNDPNVVLFAKQVAAAYVNLVGAGGGIPPGVYDLDKLKQMWTYGPAGSFHPVPGVNWGVGDIQAFLTKTWN